MFFSETHNFSACFFRLFTEQHRFSDRRTEEHKRESGQAFPYRWITFFTSTSTKSWPFACKVAYFTGFLRKFLFVSTSTYPLLTLYLSSTYPLLNLYLSSTFILLSLHPISTKIAGIFRHDAFIPNLGMLRSQFGSVLFPTWESHIPKLGMHAIRGLTIFS